MQQDNFQSLTFKNISKLCVSSCGLIGKKSYVYLKIDSTHIKVCITKDLNLNPTF